MGFKSSRLLSFARRFRRWRVGFKSSRLLRFQVLPVASRAVSRHPAALDALLRFEALPLVSRAVRPPCGGRLSSASRDRNFANVASYAEAAGPDAAQPRNARYKISVARPGAEGRRHTKTDASHRMRTGKCTRKFARSGARDILFFTSAANSHPPAKRQQGAARLAKMRKTRAPKTPSNFLTSALILRQPYPRVRAGDSRGISKSDSTASQRTARTFEPS